MSAMFHLTIVTPEKVICELDIRSLTVPGAEGYLGVLSQHAPLITSLKPGRIRFRDTDERLHIMAVTNGFLEVSNNVATLLADAVERAQDIDIERARTARERARQSLSAARRGESDVDIAVTLAALARATNRIRIFEEASRKGST